MYNHLNRYSRGRHPFEHNSFDNLVDHLYGDLFQQEAFFQESATLNIYEGDDTITVMMKSSGLNKENINVHSDGRSLVIEWEKSLDFNGEVKDNKVLLEEINQKETIRRQITLPSLIKEEGIGASYENGILTITLSKKEKVEPKKISVA